MVVHGVSLLIINDNQLFIEKLPSCWGAVNSDTKNQWFESRRKPIINILWQLETHKKRKM